MTIEHSMRHLSGLPDYEKRDSERFMKDGLPLTPERVKRYLAEDPARHFAPGAGWRYNNTGFYLSALQMAQAAGGTFIDVLTERVIEPAGLLGVDLCDDHPGPMVSGYMLDEGSWASERTLFDERGIQGDGGLCGSILDLVRVPEALSRALGTKLWARMTAPTSLPGVEPVDYGMGLSIAVLVNTDGPKEDARTIFGRVAAEVLQLDVDRDAFERGEYPLDRIVQRQDGQCASYYNGFFMELGPCK